ncbi:MAG: hypothetical protein CBC19_00625 [Oceanospirillales bacterium TMED59]|nr:MAG: hypothetical protein CBC19_00625 [Oceanospirillales bacterium TMED59]
MLKESVIENKRKKNLEKKRRLKVFHLRNKFLAEWASSVLGLSDDKKITYINKVSSPEFYKDENQSVVGKIEKDFIKKNIKISFKEIEYKIKDFQIKANVIIENKFKINNWR